MVVSSERVGVEHDADKSILGDAFEQGPVKYQRPSFSHISHNRNASYACSIGVSFNSQLDIFELIFGGRV